MEQALAVRWKQSRKSKNGSCNQTGTVFNILHAFDLQLHKIRTQNLQKSTSNLGGTANITHIPGGARTDSLRNESGRNSMLHQSICGTKKGI
jgi:hypothetical protein